MANESSTFSSSGYLATDVMSVLPCIVGCAVLVGCMTAAQNTESDLRRRREEMVEQQIRQRGVADTRVLAAMRSVPRERFVPPDLLQQAYEDRKSTRLNSSHRQ